MKLLIPFRILRWWRWLLAVNKLIRQYKKGSYSAYRCPLCTTKMRGDCSDCPWVKFEGQPCTFGLEKEYKSRIRRLRRWKVRMIYGKKASEAWARKEENA